MAPVVAGRKGEFTKLFADLQKEGFSRVRIDGEIVKLSGEPVTLNKKIKHFIDVVVDRVTLKESAQSRIAEAVELACKLAQGRVLVQVLGPDGKPLGEAGTPRAPRAASGRESICSRWPSRAPSTATPWTSWPRDSPSTPLRRLP